MPIESPQLDDLRYRSLFEQLRRSIAIYTPEWTEYNDSDPGITLLQLFAHLGEQIGYRLNRVPDKVYVELLRLIGMRLRPAEAARTLLAFYFGKAELALASTIVAGAKVNVRGRPAIGAFEVDAPVDVVPGQLAAMVTTQSADLRDLAAGTTAPVPGDTAASYLATRYALAWDGKQPKLKDWPQQPVPMFFAPDQAGHEHLWLGLAFNRSPSAGFLGQRVTLTVQLDDDELPDPRAIADCGDRVIATPAATAGAEYVFYRPPRPGQPSGAWVALPILSDTTDGWTRSGQVRFDVPLALGPIPDGEWEDPRPELPLTMEQICADATGTGTPVPAPIRHPLVGAIKNPVSGLTNVVPISGWIGVRLVDRSWRFSLRAVTFNAGLATNAETVRNQLLGRGNGLSDQTARLPHGNILAGTLELALEDPVDLLLHRWTQVEDFDTAAPDDRVFALDPEAGLVYFGDGVRGRVPAMGRRIVALAYRHGGGKAAEVPPGDVNQPASLPPGVQDAVNVVAARGGKDAETVAGARRRAPSVLRTRSRAVTAEDFEVIARETPGVRIARALAVPLRRPIAIGGVEDAPGLDVDTVAAGVVSVVVVPDAGRAPDHAQEPYPTAPEGVLRTVCRHLDRFRLITTEVYVVPAQYVRIFDVELVVVPRPGWSAADVRASVAARLSTYFHVLTGGADGTGTPFGAVIHHSELVAQVMRTEGVDRVESLTAWFDGQAPAPPDEPPPMTWRDERAVPRRLTACPETDADTDELALLADENVFVDTASLTVIVRT
jgi:predicted phage baseplate assembly protein